MTLANPQEELLKCSKHTNVVHRQHLNVLCQAEKHFQMCLWRNGVGGWGGCDDGGEVCVFVRWGESLH